MGIKELINKIKPEKNYSLSGAIKLGVFEQTIGYRSYPPCLNFILKDTLKGGAGILKAKMAGEGPATLYMMQGKNIINFLKMYEEKKSNKSGEEKSR